MFTPDSVSVPPDMVRPPVPPITPESVPAALLNVSVCEPSVTEPAPDSVLTVAPAVVPEMFRLPATETPDELAMLPEPDRASVAPVEIDVAPL